MCRNSRVCQPIELKFGPGMHLEVFGELFGLNFPAFTETDYSAGISLLDSGSTYRLGSSSLERASSISFERAKIYPDRPRITGNSFTASVEHIFI